MSWTLLWLLPLLSVLLIDHQVLGDDVEVKTKKGTIKGKNVPADISTTNIAFDAFLGIPYGDKPDRFQLAKARTEWADALKTQTDHDPCPQPGGVTFSEDCLYLNVFTPSEASTSSDKVPVIAFLPGGYFTVNSASSEVYGPDFLVSGKVILVTINYRVGAAGFLSLGSKEAPGNLGLHDTLLALQWIQDEISAFGGDSTNVTLFGRSSGSVMAQFHYLSHLSTGLFHRAITQSGSALASWGHVTATEARQRAIQLAKRLKCDTTQNDTVILKCLQAADINDIVSNQTISLSTLQMIAGNALPFVPVLDANTADKPFFNDSLENLIKAAAGRAKPLLSGITSDEGILIFATSAYSMVEANLAAFIPEGTRNSNKVNSIKNLYFNQSSPTLNKVKSIVSLYTDYLFANPAIKISREFATFTYGYEFAYDGTWLSPELTKAYSNFYQYNMRGVGHGADLDYIFYSTSEKVQSMDTCKANVGNVDMKNNMVKWWTNFATKGVPADNWPTVTKGGYFVINSQTSIKAKEVFEKEHNYNFWDELSKFPVSGSAKSTNILLTLFVSLIASLKRFYL